MSNELYQLKEETKQNTKDIAAVVRTVDRLALIQENAEKSRIEDRDILRELAKNTQALEAKITEALHMANDVAKLKEDYRALSHDIKNHDNVITGLVPKIEQIIKNDVSQGEQLKVLNDWHKREREKDLIEVGGEQLKKKQWQVITAVGSACAAIAGFIAWCIGYFLR